MASSFDKYFASWLDLIPKKMYDNIMKKSPVMMMMLKNKKEWDSGGDTIRPHIKYKQADNVGSYRGYDTLDITPQSTRTDAEFRLKQLYASIVLNGYEDAASKGELAIFKMMEIASTDAEEALRDLISQQIFSDGTGNSSKDLLGLEAAVDDGTNVGTYAGINRATYTWWKSQYNGAVGALTLAKMRAEYTACARGGMSDKPDYIVAGIDAWNYYATIVESNATIQQPIGKNAELFANQSFAQLSFMGIPVVYDEYCPADEMYFLNSNTINLWTKPGMTFKPTEMVKPANMDAKIGQILFYGEIICTEPRSNAHLKGITAPV